MKHAHGLSIPGSLDEACDPARMALLVYDMQVGILQQIPNRAEVLAKVIEVLQSARRAGVRTFFCRHMSLPRELMGVAQMRTAMAWQRVDSPELIRPWFLRDTPPFGLVPEVTPLPSEAVFDKITMSAFEGTPLDIALRDCGIQTVAVVGVALEVGIEPTLRHAADLGYIPVLVADACGAGNAEAARRSLDALRFAGDCLITDVAMICNRLERTRPAG